eukprot:6171247-Prymnesium_polylepis.1
MQPRGKRGGEVPRDVAFPNNSLRARCQSLEAAVELRHRKAYAVDRHLDFGFSHAAGRERLVNPSRCKGLCFSRNRTPMIGG